MRLRVGYLTKKSQSWLSVAPVGLQADYRTELLIASSRAAALHVDPDKDYIATTSLIDSLAYSVTNVRRAAEGLNVNPEMVDAGAWAAGCIMWLFRHSLRYDYIFFIESDNLSDEQYDFQELLRQVLEDNNLPYEQLVGEPEEWVDQVVEVIESYGRS